MLVGGRVQDDLRPKIGEDAFDLGPVPDIRHHGKDLRGRPPKAIHQVEELRLVDVKEGGRTRLELEHRPGQLAADRASGPGDQNPFPVQELADGRVIDLDLVPARAGPQPGPP